METRVLIEYDDRTQIHPKHKREAFVLRSFDASIVSEVVEIAPYDTMRKTKMIIVVQHGWSDVFDHCLYLCELAFLSRRMLVRSRLCCFLQETIQRKCSLWGWSNEGHCSSKNQSSLQRLRNQRRPSDVRKGTHHGGNEFISCAPSRNRTTPSKRANYELSSRSYRCLHKINIKSGTLTRPMKAECQLIRHFLCLLPPLMNTKCSMPLRLLRCEWECDGVRFLFLLEFIYREIKS